ncbi:MAG TPA: alpha/beta hydrolase domain-containing protein [Burkholderiaceae bacterium]|nr:alpha/beta hydrolase domain-containing protein [Burkholderiaceae bacterium]
MSRPWAPLAAVIVLFAASASARAAVERVEVLERVPFAPGTSFGEAGAYEKIRAIAHFALDPAAPANAGIVDLKRAPRDGRGRVTFASEFVLLRPVKVQTSTLIYDVNNRGRIAILGQLNGRSPANNDPTTAADAGDGFLMRHGFTLLFSAWTWDAVPPSAGAKPLIFAPPVAKGPGGAAITGPVENEFIVSAPTDLTTYAGLLGLTYEPAVSNDTLAVLTARARPEDARQPIARSRWRLLAPERAGGPGRVQLDGGFQPGTIYELTYTTQDPYVTGAGLAGIRDLLAYFRDHPFEGAPAPPRVLIFGISQSGRVIGRMLHDGLDVDETGKLAFDGAYLQVPGAGSSAGFNSRFAQPTRHPSMLEEHDYPTDEFPFTTAPTRDPVTASTASLLDHARDARGRLPKLIIANTSTEYWNRGASLITTTADGARDVAPADNVRIYGFMGAQHYVGRSRTRAPYVNCVSTTDHYLPMRALILALERWAGVGQAPPSSAYPQLSDGTLVTVAAYRAAFPKGMGLSPPEQNLREPRLDFGPRFRAEGVASRVPPQHGPAYETRVPAPDADGNDRGGVRLVELEVPLGTHTGWNGRAPETGFAWATARWDGSFVPFARTAAEQQAAGDPRPSLEERYPRREDFIARVRTAAGQQVAAGFLLREDEERAVSESLGLYDRILAHDPDDRGCGYLFGE